MQNHTVRNDQWQQHTEYIQDRQFPAQPNIIYPPAECICYFHVFSLLPLFLKFDIHFFILYTAIRTKCIKTQKGKPPMNPESLYRLTRSQHETYLQQPDHCSGGFCIETNRTESYVTLKNTTFRFWYNTQTGGYDAHCHKALEIITPVEQKFTIIVNNVSYSLEPGDIFLIPPGVLHSYPAPDGGARFIYIFRPDFLHSLPGFSYILSLLNRPIRINNENFGDIYAEEISQILQLAEYYWQQSPLWEMKIYSGLLSFFASLGNSCLNRADFGALSPDRKHFFKNLEKLFVYVDSCFSENISLEQAAGLAGYSKFHFSRIFKECTGQTFMEYLRSVRIAEASKMLLDGRMPVHEIAFQSGFSSLTTFNRIFRQLKGCAPSEYRNFYSHIKSD